MSLFYIMTHCHCNVVETVYILFPNILYRNVHSPLPRPNLCAALPHTHLEELPQLNHERVLRQWSSQLYINIHSPPLDNIRVMVIIWRLRENIIRTALCWVV